MADSIFIRNRHGRTIKQFAELIDKDPKEIYAYVRKWYDLYKRNITRNYDDEIILDMQAQYYMLPEAFMNDTKKMSKFCKEFMEDVCDVVSELTNDNINLQGANMELRKKQGELYTDLHEKESRIVILEKIISETSGDNGENEECHKTDVI